MTSANNPAKFAILDEANTPITNIFEAAERGNAAYILKAVQRNVNFDANARDNLRRTPLHWAAEMGHTAAAEALLDFGCEVTAQECNGRTPVHLAARAGDVKMLTLLFEEVPVKERAEIINKPDNHGITALYLAHQKGEEGIEAFNYMISCGGKFGEMQLKPQERK